MFFHIVLFLAMKRGYSESPSASVGPPQSRFKHNPEGLIFVLLIGYDAIDFGTFLDLGFWV